MPLPNRKTIRAQWHDYRAAGAYFITMCTKNREHYFGEIKKGCMHLNALGAHTHHCRQQIPRFHPHVIIDEFICMPNHIHGILIITNPIEVIAHPMEIIYPDKTVGTHYMRPTNPPHPTKPPNIPIPIADGCNPSQPIDNPSQPKEKQSQPAGNQSQKKSPQCLSESVGSIIRGFKIGVTQFAQQNNLPFARQSLYYDIIIRDQTAFENIQHYISNNPKKRTEDRFIKSSKAK